ncbi:MAG: hypothetical protein ACJ74G_02760 [Blastocatellia bacterium]
MMASLAGHRFLIGRLALSTLAATLTDFRTSAVYQSLCPALAASGNTAGE